MVEFGFSQADEMLRAQVRDFAAKELKPIAKELETSKGIPHKLSLRLGEMGYLGVSIPEEHGGQGLGVLSHGIVAEELAKVSMVMGTMTVEPALLYFLLNEADKGKIKDFFPAVAQGEIRVAFGITEPEGGTDLAAMKTRGVRDGHSYVINGEKSPVSYAQLENINAYLVFLKTDPTLRARGVSVVIVPDATPGLTKSDLPWMGCKAATSSALSFDNVRVPVQNLVGEEGKAFYYVMQRLEHAKVLVALMTLAMAQTCLAESIDYTKQRKAFGKPLIKFEAISFKIAEDLTRLEMARQFCYRTLRMRDEGLHVTKEAAMCKWYGASLAVKVIHDCLLMFGHYGYSEENMIPHRLKNAIGYEIGDGTAEAQKIIILREALGREFVPY